MSMTREEIIQEYEGAVVANGLAAAAGNEEAVKSYELFKAGLDALRPVSREQVEKVWRGEWHSHYKSGIHAGNGVVCSKCDMWNNRAAHFCPSCGAPMTDEAVQMVMERMEALEDD